MLRSLGEIIGYRVMGKDGELGEVMDIYFDDEGWGIRYLVLDTRGWLPQRNVLISPEVAKEPDWPLQKLPVALDRQQVTDSPPIWSKEPVFRQQEEALARHYRWRPWWLPAVDDYNLEAPYPSPSSRAGQRGSPAQELAEPHLRSLQQVRGYKVYAAGGDEVGQIVDMVAQTEIWQIRYLVAWTDGLFRQEHVLLAPDWIKKIDWHGGAVEVSQSRNQIAESPQSDPSAPVNQEYEARLYDYYGRPRYWDL